MYHPRPARLEQYKGGLRAATRQAGTVRRTLRETLGTVPEDIAADFQTFRQAIHTVRGQANDDTVRRYLMYGDRFPGDPKSGKTCIGLARIALGITLPNSTVTGNIAEYWIGDRFSFDTRRQSAAAGGLAMMNAHLNNSIPSEPPAEYLISVSSAWPAEGLAEDMDVKENRTTLPFDMSVHSDILKLPTPWTENPHHYSIVPATIEHPYRPSRPPGI
jgi:hypothetical protein